MKHGLTSPRPPVQVAAFLASCLTVSVAWADPPAGVVEPVNPDGPHFLEDVNSPCLESADRLRWIRQWRSAENVPADVRQSLASIALEDGCEAVRYEAVMALWQGLARDGNGGGPTAPTQTVCYTKPRGLLGRMFSRLFGVSCRSRHCVSCPPTAATSVGGDLSSAASCCDAMVRDALAAIADDCDAYGGHCESSPRVRAAAAEALALCNRAGVCIPTPSVTPSPRQHPGSGEQERPDGFKIEEPPPHSGGFEPLASAD